MYMSGYTSHFRTWQEYMLKSHVSHSQLSRPLLPYIHPIYGISQGYLPPRFQRRLKLKASRLKQTMSVGEKTLFTTKLDERHTMKILSMYISLLDEGSSSVPHHPDQPSPTRPLEWIRSIRSPLSSQHTRGKAA